MPVDVDGKSELFLRNRLMSQCRCADYICACDWEMATAGKENMVDPQRIFPTLKAGKVKKTQAFKLGVAGSVGSSCQASENKDGELGKK